jgi:hypothetical protein
MKRMPFVAELRWLLAAKLMLWSLRLVEKEAPPALGRAYGDLARELNKATEYDTIPMRRR